MAKVEIEKPWTSSAEQYVSDDHGNRWSVAELIEYAKDLDVFDMPMDHLCIDRKIGGPDIRGFVAHMRLVLDADLEHPIILDENAAIFDGRHRVAKALYEGRETIKAVRFVKDPPPTSRG